MEITELKRLLDAVAQGEMSTNTALSKLKHLPFEELLGARIDHHRQMRTGQPEAIYSPGKTVQVISDAIRAINRTGSDALITRLESVSAQELSQEIERLVYYPSSRVAVSYVNADRKPKRSHSGRALVISAGSSDQPVAEEARITAEVFGSQVREVTDIGVAGIHRIKDALPDLQWCDVVIVVAGMEGALASVIGGLTDKPVIAVPTSVGYGAAFSGIAALLGMLTSCAQGVAVVNIDNGFGAGALADKIARQAGQSRQSNSSTAETASSDILEEDGAVISGGVKSQ